MRKTILLVGYNVIFVCVALGLGEYLARALAFHHPGSVSELTELVLDRWAAFRNNSNYKRNGVQTNSEGFRRDREVPLNKPPGAVRIFLLGGSVAYGGETLYPELGNQPGLDNRQTIDFHLETKLNSAFPGRQWDVINAAVKGYALNQDLAIYLSAIQRHQPDYLVLFDGVNDVFEMLRSPETYGNYKAAGFAEEFDGLTNPRSMSVKRMSSTWLLNHSALYRYIKESVSERSRISARAQKALEAVVPPDRGFEGLTLAEQSQFSAAVSQLPQYMLPVRQIHRLAEMAGTQTVFVLQPQIAVTRKPLTSMETRQMDYWAKLDGPLYVYGFRTMYPQLGRQLAAGAQAEGYRFLDLTGVFDNISAQTFTDYCHLTPAGNRAVADAIFDSLKSSFEGWKQ